MQRTGALRRSIPRRAALVAVLGLVFGTSLAFDVTAVAAAGATPLSSGLNADGQLGNGTVTQQTSPGGVNVANIVQIASGREHAYALDDQGRVWAWGDNSKGAVGDGTAVDKRTPVMVLTGVQQIEAGHYHGIALKTDGTVWTWGYGLLGQLGLGTTTNRNVPTQVPGINDATWAAAGRDMSYILRATGTLVATGGNTFGELGDGTLTQRNSPVAVQGLTNVDEVVGGRNHGLAVRGDGTLWTWGANDFGQLGDGTTTGRTAPVQVLGNVHSFDAGADHSIAVLNDGTVRTWGRGYRGQLGLGNTTLRTTPQIVPGLTGMVEVGDGRDQSFAMNVAGQVWAWGFNDTGQLGDGTTTQRNSPVQLAGLTGVVAAQGGRGMTIFLPGAATPPDPDVTPPTAPQKPTVSSTVSGRADLVWVGATDDRATLLTYTVYRDGNTTPIGQVVASTSAINVSFSDTGLVPGSTLTWQVRASDGVNLGPLSPATDPTVIAGGGTGPTVLLVNDFTTGVTAFIGAVRLSADNTVGSPTDEAPSVRVAVAAQSGTGQLALTSTATQACTSIDVSIASIGGTTQYALIKLRNAAGGSIARVQVNAARKLSVRGDIAATTFTTTRTLVAGAWNRITLCVSVASGASGQLQLRLDGATVGTWATNTGTSPLSRIQVGDNDPRTATVNWDDVVVTSGLV